MKGHIYVIGRGLTRTELQENLALYQASYASWGEPCWFYAEQESGVVFEWATTFNVPENLSTGHLFGGRFEARWQRTHADSFDLQLCSEGDFEPEQALTALTFEATDTTILLWGTHVSGLKNTHRLVDMEGEDIWVETRIPRPLRYPVEGSPFRVQIRAVGYSREGVLITTRWKGLVPVGERSSHV